MHLQEGVKNKKESLMSGIFFHASMPHYDLDKGVVWSPKHNLAGISLVVYTVYLILSYFLARHLPAHNCYMVSVLLPITKKSVGGLFEWVVSHLFYELSFNFSVQNERAEYSKLLLLNEQGRLLLLQTGHKSPDFGMKLVHNYRVCTNWRQHPIHTWSESF